MTVHQLQKHLTALVEGGLESTARVLAFDADSGKNEEVSGFLYNSKEVVLQTDDPN